MLQCRISTSQTKDPHHRRWFAHYLYGVENGVEDGPRAWIVRKNDERTNPTSYEDYPNPEAVPVVLHLIAGAPERGQLVTGKPPEQSTETLIDNFSFSGSTLAQAEWTNHRLIYLTPKLSIYPELTVDLDATSITIPLIGGIEAFSNAVRQEAE